MEFKNVTDLNIFNEISKKLFSNTYKDLLSSDQIDYMINLFFSIDEINKNIIEGYKYEYVLKHNEIIGFIVYKPYNDYLFLSKLYLYNNFKGQGICSKVLEYLSQYKLNIRLTVNKYNEHALYVYKKNGFKVIDSVVTDIGNNYVMDDYIMEKSI